VVKKRGRRPRGPAAPRVQPPAEATAARRARKEEVRAARAREARTRARRDAFRRVAVFAVAGIVGVAAITLFNRAVSAKPLSPAALAAASAAGCQPLTSPLTGDISRDHFPTGQSTPYPDHPAVGGNHAENELTPGIRVYTAPVDEARAVHNLEHGSVFLYYRPPGDPGGLSQSVIDALAPLARRNHATYLAPYADLPDGTGFALTAWNKLLTCPGSITAAQATTLAQGFVDSFACTSNAPEGKSGDGC